jgi:hypothetical protein
MNKLTKVVWKINYKIYPYLRDFILFTRLWKHTGRQNYHLGYVKDNISEKEIMKKFNKFGFEHSICSWIDDGEVLSMRKIKGDFQYHIRLFNDGELRGHYEFSPERSPIGHLSEKVFLPKKNYFLNIINELIKL